MDTIRIEFPLKDKNILTEINAVKVMMKGLQDLIKVGAIKGELDTILVDYEFNDKLGYAIAILKKDALVDSSKLQTVGGGLISEQDGTNPLDLEVRGFSVATIQERMKAAAMNPKIRFRLTIQDYKKYWKSSLSKIKTNPLLARRLRNMFLTDLTGIFSEVLPYIEGGKQLGMLVGINTVTEGMEKVAKDLSMAYKKALQQSKNGLSKNILKGLQVTYTEFINLLVKQVFPGIEEIIKGAENVDKNFSTTSVSTVTLTLEDSKRLLAVIDYLKDTLDLNTPEVTVKIICEDKSKEFKLNKSNTEIISIETKESTVAEYSYLEDGRIKLF
jgi:hypothetical protein